MLQGDKTKSNCFLLYLHKDGDCCSGHSLCAPLGAVVGRDVEVVDGLTLKVEVGVAGANLAADRVDLKRGLLWYL